MMHKGLYKESRIGTSPGINKFLPAFFVITVLVGVVFLGYKFLKNGITPDQTVALRSAAPVLETEQIQNYSAKIEAEKFGGYAYRGQKDVELIRFSLDILRGAGGVSDADNPPKIKKVAFVISGYSDTADLVSLQLYLDKKMIAQTPFADGKAVFDNLALQFDGESKLNFEVKANAGENAVAGNRVQIAISNPEDILIQDGNLNSYSVAGDFPIESGYFTIVGNKIG